MRNIDEVVLKMKDATPPSHDFFRSCANILESILYMAPESLIHMWYRVQETVMQFFDKPYPDMVGWEKNVINIWTDGQAKDQYEQSGR